MKKIKLSKATKVVKEVIKRNMKDWPEDEWFWIGQYKDLNLYKKDGENCAAIYNVNENGQTITDSWTVIDLKG